MGRKGVGFLFAEDVEEVVVLGWNCLEEFRAFLGVQICGIGSSEGCRRFRSVLYIDDR
jgi:hypothetical protein